MSEISTSKPLRWIARIWSLASVAFVLLFVLGEGLGGTSKPTVSEWIGLAFWPTAVCIGLALAWFREAVGGILATTSLVAFYVWHLLDRGTFPSGPYFLLVAWPGVLFLLLSLSSRPRQKIRPA
jgi:hypothetical protein